MGLRLYRLKFWDNFMVLKLPRSGFNYPLEYQQWEICPKYWTSKTERLQLFQSSYHPKTGCPIPWTSGATICTVVLKLEVSKRR